MATSGRFDEDRTKKIKEKVEPASWDCGPLIARYVASSWPSKLFKRNDQYGYQAINSSINQCNLLRKYNS